MLGLGAPTVRAEDAPAADAKKDSKKKDKKDKKKDEKKDEAKGGGGW